MIGQIANINDQVAVISGLAKRIDQNILHRLKN